MSEERYGDKSVEFSCTVPGTGFLEVTIGLLECMSYVKETGKIDKIPRNDIDLLKYHSLISEKDGKWVLNQKRWLEAQNHIGY